MSFHLLLNFQFFFFVSLHALYEPNKGITTIKRISVEFQSCVIHFKLWGWKFSLNNSSSPSPWNQQSCHGLKSFQESLIKVPFSAKTESTLLAVDDCRKNHIYNVLIHTHISWIFYEMKLKKNSLEFSVLSKSPSTHPKQIFSSSFMNNLCHRLYDIYCQNQTILLLSAVDSKEFKWTGRIQREKPF